MDTESLSLFRPRFLHSSMFTGMLAAELRVKNAVTPESLMQRHTSGNGFLRKQINARMGFVTNATAAMDASSTTSSMPYSVKISRPFVPTDVYTKPRMPNGAREMIQRTTCDTASEMAENTSFTPSFAWRRAMPSKMAQAKMPR